MKINPKEGSKDIHKPSTILLQINSRLDIRRILLIPSFAIKSAQEIPIIENA